jgi:Protein of unknown function (DUF2384)
VATAFAHEAVRARDVGHLNDQLLARATGAARSTARAWLGGRTSPRGRYADRVVELSEIVDRLARVVDPEYIPVWLTRPVEALGDDKPIDLIRRGQYRAVARVVSSLEDPGAA